jgi:hypothetical protein
MFSCVCLELHWELRLVVLLDCVYLNFASSLYNLLAAIML